MLREAIRMLLAIIAASGFGGYAYAELTDEEYSRFPRLFQLDDYEECLQKPGGLYCMGEFQLSPLGRNPTFELMREYSKNIHNYNRTLVYRGHCVSERCPTSLTHPTPPAARFARCIATWGERRELQTKLYKLNYCTTHEEYLKGVWSVETPHMIFLLVLGVILLMNVVGTIYDTTTDGKKNKMLTSWSVVSNWQRLMAPFPPGDPRLAALLPVEAARVLIISFSVVAHCTVVHVLLYLQNPRYMEQTMQQPLVRFLTNASSMIQMFFMLSSFFLAQGLLREPRLTFRMLPRILLKRAVRIAPVYLLTVGFAATWWPLTRGGPQWGPLVVSESAVCRKKFWALAFFVGNFVRDDENCQAQTWFIGVDMQLYILAAFLTVLLSKTRRPLSILGALFVITNVINILLAYSYGWQPPVQYWGLQNIRIFMANIESFRMFYIKPWGSLPSSFVGLFLAHLLHQLKDFSAKDRKMVILICQLFFPVLLAWGLTADNVFRTDSAWSTAVYTALERPAMCLLFAPLLFGVLNGNGRQIDKSIKTEVKSSEEKTKHRGYIHKIFGWRGWYPMGRMSLAVMMLNWCINLIFAGSRPALYATSTLDTIVDFLATMTFTYLLAMPVTLLLDIPLQQLVKTMLT